MTVRVNHSSISSREIPTRKPFSGTVTHFRNFLMTSSDDYKNLFSCCAALHTCTDAVLLLCETCNEEEYIVLIMAVVAPLLTENPSPDSVSFMTQAHPTSYMNTSAVAVSYDTDSDDGYETPLDELLPSKSNVEEENEVSVAEKIVEQLEYYFSDENLLRDAFLMKHITRNKEGYVSLKLIASLRKIKALSKDHEAIKKAVEQSSKISLNGDGTKLRRLSPPPKIDYSCGNRSVLVLGLEETTTSEEVENAVKSFGNVIKIRMFQPKRAIPLEIKAHSKLHPQIGTETIAVVEFASSRVADRVCDQTPTGPFRFEKLGRKEKSPNNRDTTRQSSPGLGNKKERKPAVQVVVEREGSSSSETESLSPKSSQKPRSGRKNGNLRKGQQWTKSTGHFLQADRQCRDSDSGYSQVCSSPSPSPELKRRFRVFNRIGNSSPSVTVIRQPKGPDGTRGFV